MTDKLETPEPKADAAANDNKRKPKRKPQRFDGPPVPFGAQPSGNEHEGWAEAEILPGPLIPCGKRTPLQAIRGWKRGADQ